MLRRFPGERIHIIYAGCGPYGTLLLPLTTQFTPEQMELTLIDIHELSIDGVRGLIEALGIEDYIYQCVQANAVTYRHPSEIPLHMVVSETMEAGLAREPQLAIMRNFLPQLHENGLFIPENIVVDAYLSSSEEEDIGLLMHRDEFGYPVGREIQLQADRLPLGRVIALNLNSAYPQEIGHGWDAIPLTTLEIPPRDECLDQFLLLTTVSIFGSYKFTPYDCELSFPIRLHDLNQVASGSRIQFSYIFGQKPGLHHEVLYGEGMYMEQQITLRPITPDDEPFLCRLYASTREDELAVLPWSESEKEVFLTTQFIAQHTYYHQKFCDAEFHIIEHDDEPIGRLYLDRRDDEIRIIDIALLPAYRNRGIGSKYLEAILEEGRGAKLPIRIHVEHNNPALNLYNRLGFQKVTENGVYFLMEKLPDKAPGG